MFSWTPLKSAVEAESTHELFPVGQGFQVFITHNIFLTLVKKALIDFDETKHGESGLHRGKGWMHVGLCVYM